MEIFFIDTQDVLECMHQAYTEFSKQSLPSTPKVMLLPYGLYGMFIYEMYKKMHTTMNPLDPYYMNAKVRECGRMDKNKIEVY